MELSSTHLRYLYAIYEIFRTSPEIRSSIIASRMEVSRPSVAKMLGVLIDKGLIEKEKYGKIHITEKGLIIAREFDRRVCVLTDQLKNAGLGLTDGELHKAVCILASVINEKSRVGSAADGLPTGA
ncbi:MAG TPA: hypothetical protein DIV41_08710 [Ruminococcaceae bacterium]|nr:hypothetical protein [Oscillospiraceae bacterium]